MAISKISKSTVASGINKYDNFAVVDYPTLPYTEGLVMWYDADDVSSISLGSGTQVSQWNDKSGNARHASQSNSSLRPNYLTNQLNGKPVIDFGAATGTVRLDIASNQYQFSTKSIHAFAVGKTRYESNTDFSSFFGGYAASQSTSAGSLAYSFPGNAGSLGNGSQQFLNTSRAWFPSGNKFDYSSSQFYQVNASWDGVTVAYRQSRTDDGSAVFDGTGLSNKISYPCNAIGWQEGPSYGSTITIAELIIYDKPLSASDIEKVESYLFSKWGV